MMQRRDFLKSAAWGAASVATGAWLGGSSSAIATSPNEKLNLGIIGCANRAASNIAGVQHENIVAVCDIDDKYLGAAGERFSGAKTYNDFRKLLEQKGLDAVVVSTADHVHAPASVAAMKLGLHVYCEKPLSHSVQESRVAAETAAKYKVATQMGTQVHAENTYRRVVEVIGSGAIGQVTECHVWEGKSWSGGERPTETPEIPANIHWDLWLGPAPARPYHPTYLPANWRRWWDFGSGTLGDMGCHYLDLPFWALRLKYPTAVAAEGPPVHPETTPPWMIVTWDFPAREALHPVKLVWYDGGKQPALLKEHSLPAWGSGVLFVGEQGMLQANYGEYRLFPEKTFEGFQPPAQSIAPSVGHYQEWINACKTGSATLCNFEYSGALSETVLLGMAAYRAGQKLEWDAAALTVKNVPAAQQYIQREYRKGWTL